MRILVVEDACVLRAVFAQLAATLGHTVCGEATDVDDGLRLASELTPEAIVLDGRLTPACPADVSRLQAAAPTARIYVVAALRETALVAAARAAGAAGVLLRPFTRTQVAAVLNSQT